ncbi:hypothetical protein [Caproiciproducens sp.]
MKIQKRALSLVLALSMAVTAFSGTAVFAAEDTGDGEPAKDSQSELAKGDELSWDGGLLKTSFTWSSETGIGSADASTPSPTGYTYYSDGAYLRFQIKDSNENILKFADVFGPSDEDNDTKGAMTLQTIKEEETNPPVNDMDGSKREKADWNADEESQFKTNLPNPDDSNYIFYGLTQNKTDGTKTVGFNSGDKRTVNMTLTPQSDLEPGTYTLTVEALQQGNDEPQSEISYTFDTEKAADVCYVGGMGEDHFETLSEALEKVADKGTVYLDSNITVATTVDVTKPVTIDGQGHTITAAEDIKASNLSGKNHVLDIFQTHDVALHNLTIDGSNKARGGIIAYKTQGVCLEDVSVSNCKIGVLVDNEASVTVDGNLELKNNEWGGINVDPKDGDKDTIKLTVENDATIEFQSPSDKDTPPVWVDFPNKPETDDEALTDARKFVELPENWESVYYPDKDNGQVWFSISSASESAVLPLNTWQGPAGKSGQTLTAQTTQSFVFPFKTTGGISLSELQLDIYLGDKTGENRDYKEAVQLNLLADTSVPADFTKESLNALLGQIPAEKKTEKENTIKLLAAAGAEFDETGKVTSVDKLNKNISYKQATGGIGTWRIKLDTTKLSESKIEFLTMVRASDGTTWGNNNYVSFPEETKAYCYTIQSQEAYDEAVTEAADAVKALLPAADTDVTDPDTANAIKDAVSNVQRYGEDVTKKLDADAIDNLESLLAKLTKDKVSTGATAAAPEEMDENDKIPEVSAVSGLLLASGITGDEEDAQVSLTMEQSEPTVEGALLAFDLKLTVAQSGSEPEEMEPVIPVTVTFTLPASFVYNSSKIYKIQHMIDEDETEMLPLTFSSDHKSASFTTSSFSAFALISTPKNSGSDHDSDHHSSSGSNSGTPATPSAPGFISDTTMDFSVNGAYQFRITSTNGAAPSLVAGTAGVFETRLVSVSGSDYYFKLTAVGKPGDQTGIYVNGIKLLVAAVGAAASSVECDTTKPIQVSRGKTYVFKLTSDEKPAFVSGNSQVFQVKLLKQSGKDYFYQVTAVGKSGQAAGFYINSDKAPVAVATVA